MRVYDLGFICLVVIAFGLFVLIVWFGSGCVFGCGSYVVYHLFVIPISGCMVVVSFCVNTCRYVWLLFAWCLLGYLWVCCLLLVTLLLFLIVVVYITVLFIITTINFLRVCSFDVMLVFDVLGWGFLLLVVWLTVGLCICSCCFVVVDANLLW